MKKTISRILTAIILLMTVIACTKEEVQKDQPYLKCSQTALEFANNSGSQTLTFTTNSDWTCTSDQSWCKITPSSGNGKDGGATVSVSCDQNASYDSRSCTLTIKAGSLSHSVSITQSESEGLIIETTEYALSNEEHTLTVEVKHNIEYDVKSNAAWIEVISTKGLTTSQITLKVLQNTSGDQRQGTVSVCAKKGSLSQDITITQSSADCLEVSMTSATLSRKSQELEFKVLHNVSYGIVIPEEASSWISDITTKSLSETTHTLSIKENEGDLRSADITVKQTDGPLCATIHITQKAGNSYTVTQTKTADNLSSFAESAQAFQRLSKSEKTMVLNYLSSKFPNAKEKVRIYNIEYPSVDPIGQKVNLSAALIIPDKAFTENRTIDGIGLAGHFTMMKEDECPTRSNSVEGVMAWKNFAMVLPDNYGMGSTNEFFQNYLDKEHMGRTNIDALLAAKAFIEDSNLTIKDKTFNFGYSQGGYGAIATERYISIHPELGISFTKTFAGGGPYDILPNFEELTKKGKSDALSLVVLSIISIMEHKISGVTYPEIFKGTLLENYREWYFSKKYSAEEVAKLLGTDKVSDVLTDAMLSGSGPIYEKFMAAATANSLTSGWRPVDDSEIYLFHSSNDNIVPFDNFTRLRNMFESTPGYYRMCYVTTTGTHTDNYITFLTNVVLPNWK